MSESSADESRPVEVYRFEIDGYDPMLFTSDEAAVTCEGDTYEPLPGLSRSGISFITMGDRADLTISVPATSLLATRVGLFATPQDCMMRFRRYQRADLDTPVTQFDLHMESASTQGAACRLFFPDVFSSGLVGKIPKNRIQSTCNWTLGDRNCGKDLALFRANVDQIAEVMNFTQPVPGKYTTQCSWADGVTPYDPLFWKGGVITGTYEDATESRTIFDISFLGANRFLLRAVLTLNKSFDIPLQYSTFTITPGCDNSFARCAVLQNTDRFAGFQYVPTERENPFRVHFIKTQRPS